jgi:hypothetical protein
VSKITAYFADRERTLRRVALMVLLYSILPVQALLPIDDPDIWWRLRMGRWIVDHQSVPYVDYFSAYDAGKPWFEYSWIFSLLVYAVHGQFGLSGLVYVIVAMALAITCAVHKLVRRAALPPAIEIALATAVLGSMKSLMTPRPWLFTILFFAIELLIVDAARRSAHRQTLWLLPPLFLIWANIHIQFVYGLAVVGFLLVESLSARMGRRLGVDFSEPPWTPKFLVLVLAACSAAVLLTPYHLRIALPILDYVSQTGAFRNIAEFHPMFFRSPGDWLALLLTIVAAFALGWQRKLLVFQSLLLLMTAALGFRARRDVWILVIAAANIIGTTGWTLPSIQEIKLTAGQRLTCALLVAMMLAWFAVQRQIFETHLTSVVERKFPAAAVRAIKASHLNGPMFNHLDWGGFLIWHDLPVAIDGRTNLYGDDRLEQSLKTWQGRRGWDANADLLKAKIILAGKHLPLAAILRDDWRYRLFYEDDVAVVYATR